MARGVAAKLLNTCRINFAQMIKQKHICGNNMKKYDFQ